MSQSEPENVLIEGFIALCKLWLLLPKKGKNWFAFCLHSFLHCNGILLLKLSWYTVRKKCSSEWEKKNDIRGWRPRICKNFEITRTIHSNSERSEQFLVTECFFNLFLVVFQIEQIRTIIIQIGKNYWDLETYRKNEEITIS